MRQLLLWAKNGGIGDHLFMRPAARFALSVGREVIIRTPWPELFHDLPVGFARPDSSMRMEKRHIESADPLTWTVPNESAEMVDIGYDIGSLSPSATPSRVALRALGAEDWRDRPLDLELPLQASWVNAAKARLVALGLSIRGYSMVYPPTVRKEWLNPARNPRYQYIQSAVAAIPGPWIAFGAHEKGVEWPVGAALPVEHSFTQGELSVGEIAALLAMARVTVTGHCFVLPLVVATRATALAVWGGFHPPEYYFDMRRLRSSVELALPMRPCACGNYFHECDTRLDMDEAIRRTIARLRGERMPHRGAGNDTGRATEADITVLVGIPTLARADLLVRNRAFLEGIQPPDGVVIVDNGGQTIGIDVPIVRPGRNLGVAGSWNFILKKGADEGYDAVILLQDDVIWDADRLAEAKRLLAENADVDLLLSFMEFSVQVHRKGTMEAIGEYDERFYPAWCEDDDYALRMIERGRLYQRFRALDPLPGSQTCGTTKPVTWEEQRTVFIEKWPRQASFAVNREAAFYFQTNRGISLCDINLPEWEWKRKGSKAWRVRQEGVKDGPATGFSLFTLCHNFPRRCRAMLNSLVSQKGCPVPIELTVFYNAAEDVAVLTEGLRGAKGEPPLLTLRQVPADSIMQRALLYSAAHDLHGLSHTVFVDADLWFPPEFWQTYTEAINGEVPGYWSCRVMNVPYTEAEGCLARWETLKESDLRGVSNGRRWDKFRGRVGHFQCVPRGLVPYPAIALNAVCETDLEFSRMAVERSGDKRSERRICAVPAYHLDHPEVWYGTRGQQL